MPRSGTDSDRCAQAASAKQYAGSARLKGGGSSGASRSSSLPPSTAVSTTSSTTSAAKSVLTAFRATTLVTSLSKAMFSRSVVAALVAAPFLATAFAASCTRTYTVKEGDWCDTISAANNVSTYQLAVVNTAIDNLCDNLEVGQNLCLGTQGEDCSNTHVVEANDTCDQLYNTYGINSTILYHNNPQLNSACDNMYIGEVMCVANAALAPAPPAGLSVPTTSSQAPATTETELPWCDEL